MAPLTLISGAVNRLFPSRPVPPAERSASLLDAQVSRLEARGFVRTGSRFQVARADGALTVQRLEKGAWFNAPWAPSLGDLTHVAFAVDGALGSTPLQVALGDYLVGPEGRYYYFDGRKLERSLVSVKEVSFASEGPRLVADVRPVLGALVSASAEPLNFRFQRLAHGRAVFGAVDSSGAVHQLSLDPRNGEPSQHQVR